MQDGGVGSAVGECRRESGALSLLSRGHHNGGKHVSSATLGSLACALGSTTTRSHLRPHTRTQPKTNGAAEVVAVVSVSFTLLTLHVQIQIHSVNAIPRGRNVKRRPISPVFEQL